MSSKGWISLDRQITDNWIWEDKPFAYGQAWIDMLMMANHSDKKVLIDKTPIEVSKGEFITSELKLMDRWGWSKSKVRRFLELLQNDGMIVKKTDRKKTTINIVNYSIYNTFETTERPQKDHRKTTKRPQKDTTNNITIKQLNKNIKNTYGEYAHVKLTDDELAKLKAQHDNVDELIKFLDEYIEEKGYKSKSHYLAIKRWVVKAVDEKKPKKNGFNDFEQSKTDLDEMEELFLREVNSI